MSGGGKERVVVFGATSAIAAEFAELHAMRGDDLHLVARNEEKLAAVVARCRGKGRGKVSSAAADFDDLDGAEGIIAETFAELGGVDRALFAHGDLGDQLATERSFAEAEKVLRTNFLSVVALLIPLVNRLEEGRSGRVGVITSVAGDRGRPRNYTYGAAKGALNIYLQGVRTRLWEAGVAITTLKLGPVDTPMTKDHPKNALFGKPRAVAEEILAAMDGKKAEAYVPRIWQAIMPVVKGTPEPLFQKIPFLSGR